MNLPKKIISFVSIFLSAQFLISPAALADQPSSKYISILVWPLKDGTSDDKGAELAANISKEISKDGSYHLIDPKFAGQILGYYNDDGGAGADEKGSDDAVKALARAKDDFFKFRYDSAQAQAENAVNILSEKMPADSMRGAELVDAYLTRALIAKAKGDNSIVKSSLAGALAIDPALKLDSATYPPSLIGIFNSEKQKILGLESGSVIIETKPAVADVYLNGIKKGTTPLKLDELPAGRYLVSIAANKYSAIEKNIEIKSGAIVNVNEELKWQKEETKSSVTSKNKNETLEVNEGLRIADIMKADKVVLVDVDETSAGPSAICRMIDRTSRSGEPPVAIQNVDPASKEFKSSSMTIAKQLKTSERSASEHRPLTRNPIFWAVVGTVAAGAIAGGLAVAMSGGSSAPSAGAVRVNFTSAGR